MLRHLGSMWNSLISIQSLIVAPLKIWTMLPTWIIRVEYGLFLWKIWIFNFFTLSMWHIVPIQKFLFMESQFSTWTWFTFYWANWDTSNCLQITSIWANNDMFESTARIPFCFVAQTQEIYSLWHIFLSNFLTTSSGLAINVPPSEASRSILVGVFNVLIKCVIYSMELILWLGHLHSNNLNLSHVSDNYSDSSWSKLEIASFLSKNWAFE